MRLQFNWVAMLAAAVMFGGAPEASGQSRELAVPTAADFGAVPIMSKPVLSPDGNRIAARGLIGGKQLIILGDITTSDRKFSRIGVPDKHQLEWLRWAGNRRVLASLSRITDVMGVEVRMTRLMMIDLDTTKTTLVGPKEQGIDGDDLVHVDSAGKFVLLSTQPSIFVYPSVYRVDLDTGKSQRVVAAQDGVWEWFADSDGIVRAGLGANGTRWWLLYRTDADGAFKRVLRRDEAREKDNGIQSFRAIPGNSQGYAIADGKNGHLAVYRFDFGTSTLGELLYENPSVDVDDFTLSEDGALQGVAYTDDRAEIAWFDPELKRLQERIDRALPDAINRVVSISRDRNRMLVWSGGAADPGIYYVYDRSARSLVELGEPYQAMRGKRLSPMKAVRYKARDGLEIRGYLTLPAGRPATGLPLVVMPHGGPYARDEWQYDPWVQYLASRGYAVLQPNFRGSTGFGRDFVERGTGQWGRGMQDDVDDGVKWLAGQGTVDLKRVCIMGASYGGYAAMWAAVRNPELYRCAISFAGVSDVASMLRYSAKSFSAPRYFRDWRARVQGDKGFELDQISPLKQVEKLTVPLLIAHGTEDDTVPLSQSRRLHDAMLKIKRPHEYVVYEGEGHGFDDPAHSTDFLNRVGTFLDKHNPS